MVANSNYLAHSTETNDYPYGKSEIGSLFHIIYNDQIQMVLGSLCIKYKTVSIKGHFIVGKKGFLNEAKDRN